MGSPKALLRAPDGRLFVTRVVDAFAAAGIADVTVVTGAHHDAIAAAVAEERPAAPPRLVRNPDPSRGQLSSLWIGMDAAIGPAVEALLVTLVDVPMIDAATISAVLAAWRRTHAPIVRPAIGDRHGHPVLFDRAMFEELRQAPLDAGAKAVLRKFAAHIVDVPVGGEGSLFDVDTPADFTALQRQGANVDGLYLNGRYSLRVDSDQAQPPGTVAALTARIAELEAELVLAHKEFDDFAHSMSHDLRAPLRAVQGFAQIAIEECGATVSESGREYLGRVSAAARKMSTLMDDLLKLSRISRAELSRGAVDASPVVRAVWRRLSAGEPGRDVHLTVADGLTVDADRRLIELVFEHLLGNARKFTGRVPSPTVEVGWRDVDGERVVFVRDNGAGFEQAYVGRLFAPFQRLHSDRDFPGSGIGLAIVHRIVRRHGGRIWAEGAVGSGATIYFTMPDRSERR
jgi:signal transduction histidine kinase